MKLRVFEPEEACIEAGKPSQMRCVNGTFDDSFISLSGIFGTDRLKIQILIGQPKANGHRQDARIRKRLH